MPAPHPLRALLASAPSDPALGQAARAHLPALLDEVEALSTRLAHTEALRDELQQQLDALHEAHAALLARHRDMERVLGEELRRARGEG